MQLVAEGDVQFWYAQMAPVTWHVHCSLTSMELLIGNPFLALDTVRNPPR